jgi:hypothetical protein
MGEIPGVIGGQVHLFSNPFLIGAFLRFEPQCGRDTDWINTSFVSDVQSAPPSSSFLPCFFGNAGKRLYVSGFGDRDFL